MARYTKSRYTKVGVCIWSDARFMSLSPLHPSGQALWLYLVTCPYAESIPGLIPMGKMALAESLGWSVEDFDCAFDDIAKTGMAEADWKARMVWLPKAIYHNPPGNVNILKHWFAELEKMPESAIKQKAIDALDQFCSTSGEGFARAFHEAFPGPKDEPESLSDSYPNSNTKALTNRTPGRKRNTNSNSDSKEIESPNSSSDSIFQDLPPQLDCQEFRAAWLRWETYYRQKKGKAFQPIQRSPAWHTILDKFKGHSLPGAATTAIYEAIAQGWGAIYPPKETAPEPFQPIQGKSKELNDYDTLMEKSRLQEAEAKARKLKTTEATNESAN